jgi:hypothetical protein
MTDQLSDAGPQPIPRPTQIDNLTADQLVAALLRLTMEISVLRDRLATQGALLEQHGLLEPQAMENYAPTAEELAARGAARTELIAGLIDDLS